MKKITCILIHILTVQCLLSSQPVMGCDVTFRSIMISDYSLEDSVAKEAITKAGCRLEKLQFPSEVSLERRMAMLASGHIDLIIGVNIRPERVAYALFSIPISEERVRLWTKVEDEFKYKNMELRELMNQDIRLLAPNDGWYGPDYEEVKKTLSHKITFLKDIKNGLTLLHKNRGDVLLGSENFEQYFQSEYKKSTVMLPQVLYNNSLRLMYSKKTVTPETVQLIDTQIQKILNEGQ